MKRLRESDQHRSNHQQLIRQRAIEQYLERYAEPLHEQLPGLALCVDEHPTTVLLSYDNVLVIPAFDEPVGFLAPVLPPTVQRTLVIVVVNAAEDGDRAAIERTQELWQSFRALSDRSNTLSTPRRFPDPSLNPLGRYCLIFHNETTTVLVVDCCTKGHQLPPNQGVGLARKIGGDIALAYMAQGVVTSDWMHYTDADVVLPKNFFQMDLETHLQCVDSAQTKLKPDDIAVMLYAFQHQPPHRHILLYELSLRYYVTQLAGARSPYAFHTIGSLMCINGLHYAKVRGFPKRKAAEDFYMLNKLAKTGAVVQLQSPIVTLASRLSHRVPFGTGAMMTQLAEVDEFMFYHPVIFQHLREWMDCIEALWPPVNAFEPWFAESQWQGVCWIDYLRSMGVEKMLTQAYRQSRDRHHFRRYLWTWFDAFRTLKLIHYLRDYHYPSLTVEEWASLIQKMGTQEFGWVSDAQPTTIDVKHLEQINQYFRNLEENLTPIVGPTISSP